MTVAAIYSLYGGKDKNEFFNENYKDKDVSSYNTHSFIELSSVYLLRQGSEIIMEGLDILEDAAINETAWWSRLMIIYRIKSIGIKYEKKEQEALNDIKGNKSNQERRSVLEAELKEIQVYKQVVNTTLNRIKEQEKNEMVLQFWDLE